MAKREIKQKAMALSHSKGVGRQLVHSVTVEDTLLPSPDDLERYAKLNPLIVEFLMESARNEQAHRHALQSSQVKLVDQSDRRIFSLNVLGLILAFSVLIAGLGLSTYLIYLEKMIEGSLFAGATIILGARMFIFKPNTK